MAHSKVEHVKEASVLFQHRNYGKNLNLQSSRCSMSGPDMLSGTDTQIIIYHPSHFDLIFQQTDIADSSILGEGGGLLVVPDFCKQ